MSVRSQSGHSTPSLTIAQQIQQQQRLQQQQNHSQPRVLPGFAASAALNHSHSHSHHAQAGPSTSYPNQGQPYTHPSTGHHHTATHAHRHLGSLALERSHSRPPPLETGPRSRLLLALRSPLDSEINWSLRTLLEYSFTSPSSLHLPSTPGLLDALLSLVRSRSHDRQRAKDALLILRNIAVEKHVGAFVSGSSSSGAQVEEGMSGKEKDRSRKTLDKLKEVMTDVLVKGDEEKDTELILNALDVLTAVAGTITLEAEDAGASGKGRGEDEGEEGELDEGEGEEQDEDEAADEADHSQGGRSRSRSAPAPTGASTTATTTTAPTLQHPRLLYPTLVRLTSSFDRALLLSSYHLLSALTHDPRNEPFFSSPSLLSSDPSDPNPTPAHPPPLKRALTLLPLLDLSISLALLDYIYIQTAIPSVAQWVCAGAGGFSEGGEGRLRHTLRLLVQKAGTSVWREEREWVPRARPPSPSDEPAQKEFKTQPHPQSQPDKLNAALPPSGDITVDGATAATQTTPQAPTTPPLPIEERTKLTPEELEVFRNEPEPKRSIAWLYYVFESQPGYEIAQVGLWNAYRVQFTSVDLANEAAGRPKTMLAAADVIKHSTVVFPTALPMVSAQNAYVIANLKVRERKKPEETYACQWTGCETPSGPSNASELYAHIREAHLDPTKLQPTAPSDMSDDSLPTSVPSYRCLQPSCSYHIPSTSTGPDAALASTRLLMHVRTHIPPTQSPATTLAIRRALKLAERGPDAISSAGGAAHVLGSEAANEDSRQLGVLGAGRKSRSVMYVPEMDGHDQPTGVPLLAVLVLRNLARCTREAVEGPLYPAHEAAVAAANAGDAMDGERTAFSRGLSVAMESRGSTPAVGTPMPVAMLTDAKVHGNGEDDDDDYPHRRRSFFPQQNGAKLSEDDQIWWSKEPGSIVRAKEAFLSIERDLLRAATESKGIDEYLAEVLDAVAVMADQDRRRKRKGARD